MTYKKKERSTDPFQYTKGKKRPGKRGGEYATAEAALSLIMYARHMNGRSFTRKEMKSWLKESLGVSERTIERALEPLFDLEIIREVSTLSSYKGPVPSVNGEKLKPETYRKIGVKFSLIFCDIS